MHDMIRKMMLRFRDSESGATLVEYGIAITLAIVVGGALLTQLGGAIQDNITDAEAVMQGNDPTSDNFD